MADIPSEKETYFSNLIATEPAFNVLNVSMSKFVSKMFNDKIYVEYDKFRANTLSRRNCKIEFKL